jgi:hypothetical protein
MDMARFPSTQWSLVGRAGHITGERRREALTTLLRRHCGHIWSWPNECSPITPTT